MFSNFAFPPDVKLGWALQPTLVCCARTWISSPLWLCLAFAIEDRLPPFWVLSWSAPLLEGLSYSCLQWGVPFLVGEWACSSGDLRVGPAFAALQVWILACLLHMSR